MFPTDSAQHRDAGRQITDRNKGVRDEYESGPLDAVGELTFLETDFPERDKDGQTERSLFAEHGDGKGHD